MVIPEQERDEQLGARLGSELDAVLAWLVSGYLDWQAHGLDEPEKVSAANGTMRWTGVGLAADGNGA